VGQDYAVLIGLQPKGRDEIATAASGKSHLVDVHRRRVGLEDAVSDPLLEGLGGALVVGARPDQADYVVRRQRAITLELRLRDDVIRWRDEGTQIAGAREVISKSRERPDVSRRSLP
jgi:hypothetical protein